jgi:hypothetical protein
MPKDVPGQKLSERIPPTEKIYACPGYKGRVARS